MIVSSLWLSSIRRFQYRWNITCFHWPISLYLFLFFSFNLGNTYVKRGGPGYLSILYISSGRNTHSSGRIRISSRQHNNSSGRYSNSSGRITMYILSGQYNNLSGQISISSRRIIYRADDMKTLFTWHLRASVFILSIHIKVLFSKKKYLNNCSERSPLRYSTYQWYTRRSLPLHLGELLPICEIRAEPKHTHP